MGLLENKFIIVTGAAQGIGFSAAESILNEKANVLICDVDRVALEIAEKKLSKFSKNVIFSEIDIRSENSINQALDKVKSWNHIDGLVNNAAILDINNVETINEERWNKVIDTNLTGALRMIQKTIPKLKKSEYPAIINTLSTQAFFAVNDSLAYSTAKGGLLMLTRSMAVDLGKHNIRVNAIAPGFIDTRMAYTESGEHEHEMESFKDIYITNGKIPLKRGGSPEDCSGSFVFLLSNMSQYITGQTIFVDGGLSCTY